MSKDKEIDVEAIEAKLQRVKVKSDNPHAKAYGDKLSELLNSKVSARDNFINWLTGLATGSMFLAFSNVAAAPDNVRLVLFFSGLVSFLCILSAMAFKVLLEVRFSALELEVSLLKNIWEGHDIRSQLNEMMTSGKEVSDEDRQKFLRNMDESLNYLDEGYLERTKKPINRKSRFLSFSYWQTLVLFVAGAGLMASYYVLLLSCSRT